MGIHQAGIRGIEGVLPNDKPEWKAALFDRMNSLTSVTKITLLF